MTRDDAVAAPEVRVVIAGGGTGGHLTPALALARELMRRAHPPVRVTLVGGWRGPDREVLGGSGLPHRLLSAPALERRRWWRNVTLPPRLAIALGAARRIVRELDPHVVVGTGGYVSVPVVLAAALARVPILLQEQNRVPGLATRRLARRARRVCVQFPESAAALRGATVEVTGSPIEPPVAAPADFADRLDPALPTIGLFGGSQGARALNDAALACFVGDSAALDPDAPRCNLIWQTGAADAERVRAAAAWPDRFVIRAFFSPMGAVYPLLDGIVCRAGAMTLAECTAWGVPAILVPYPFATADHQTANARALALAGAALLVPERELDGRRLGVELTALLADPARRAALAEAARRLGRPEAARVVADRVLELAAERRGAPAGGVAR